MKNTPEMKRNELARLFDRLAARWLQANATGITNGSGISQSHNTVPILISKRIVSLSRGVTDLQESRRSASRPDAQRTRRNTVATMYFDKTSVPESGMSGDGDSSIGDGGQFIATFPLPEDTYAFTFKYKIYKLYKKEEWIRTVKDVLEKSRKDFRPLAETELPKSPTRKDFHSRCVPMSPGYGKRGERRSSKTTNCDVKPRLSPASPVWHERHPPLRFEEPRALKKRCVRGSICTDPSGYGGIGEGGRKDERRTLHYASTVSSGESLETEIVHPHSPGPIPISPSESFFSVWEHGSSDSEGTESPVTPTSPNLYMLLAPGFPGYAGIKHPPLTGRSFMDNTQVEE